MTASHLAMAAVALALPGAVGGLAQTAHPAAPGPPAPRIQFAAPVFDFGEIPAGAVVNHDFVFTNAGTATLVVSGVQPSCDCTTAGRWTVILEAGQTGRVPIRFNSAGYGGPIDKWVMVASNDPRESKAMLTVKGMVRKPIEVAPPNAVFTAVAGASAAETKVVRITNNTKEPLTLSAPECGSRAFVVELRTVRPGKEFELRVTTVPPLGAGTVAGLITMKTNSSQAPVIAVTALAVVRKPITAAQAFP